MGCGENEEQLKYSRDVDVLIRVLDCSRKFSVGSLLLQPVPDLR